MASLLGMVGGAADGSAGSADTDVAEHYEDMIEKGAAQEGEGKPGL